jgi:hypothetical protein
MRPAGHSRDGAAVACRDAASCEAAASGPLSEHRQRTGHRPPSLFAQYKLTETEPEAPDAATAIEKAAVQFKVPANRLMAVRR